METITLRVAMGNWFRREEHQPCWNCKERPLLRQYGFHDGVASEVLVFAFDRVHDTSVEFPLEMDLADMPGRGHARYRLVGIVNDSHNDYSHYRSGAQYYTEFAIDGHWYLIDGEVAYDLGDKPTTTTSKRVRELYYERIEEANRRGRGVSFLRVEHH
jgi:hypothetical protein